jgi:hypothetical protein
LRTSICLGATIVALLLMWQPAVADEKPRDTSLALQSYESEHYRLQTDIDKSSAEEYLRVLEAAWPQYEEFFDAAPRLKKDEKLVVNFLKTGAEWETKLTEDGVSIPKGAGGYYWPGTRATYLFKQPTLYNTRQLLIHEAMHQFHYLARCKNVSPKDTWYIEGIVENFSRHYWDGDKLTPAVIPFCSLANYPKKALEAFSAKDYDLAGMINGDRSSTRAEQWALVRFLLEADEGKYLKGWKLLAKKLDGGQSARNVFRKVFGDPAKLQPKILEWLKTQQEPFVPVWNEWQGQGANAVIGTSNVTSACRTREDATELSATLHVPQGDWKGGLLIGFEDNENYTVALLNSGGGVSVNQRVSKKWKVLKRGKTPAAQDGEYHLKAVRNGDKITLTVNEIEIGSFGLKGKKLGVCLENCTLRFTGIKWK